MQVQQSYGRRRCRTRDLRRRPGDGDVDTVLATSSPPAPPPPAAGGDGREAPRLRRQLLVEDRVLADIGRRLHRSRSDREHPTAARRL